jgi:hypothetical protein
MKVLVKKQVVGETTRRILPVRLAISLRFKFNHLPQLRCIRSLQAENRMDGILLPGFLHI